MFGIKIPAVPPYLSERLIQTTLICDNGATVRPYCANIFRPEAPRRVQGSPRISFHQPLALLSGTVPYYSQSTPNRASTSAAAHKNRSIANSSESRFEAFSKRDDC